MENDFFQLREILNEMAPSNGDDSIYSTLMRKNKKKKMAQKEKGGKKEE